MTLVHGLYSLCCIHGLPADIADLVDNEYWCPVVVQSRLRWPPAPGDTVVDGVIVRLDNDHMADRPGYVARYGLHDFHVLVDTPEVSEDQCVEAVARLNRVIEGLGLGFSFKYDRERWKNG